MKRKIISLLLSLLLLVPALALAEGTPYADPDGAYSLVCPEGWTLVSRETIDSTLEEAKNAGNDELTATIENAQAAIKEQNIVLMINEDGTANINLVTMNAGVAMTAEDMLAQAEDLKAQLTAALPGLQFTQEPQIVDLEIFQVLETEYTYTLNDTELAGVQCYYDPSGTLYTFTLTSTPAAIGSYAVTLGEVLGSLQIAE